MDIKQTARDTLSTNRYIQQLHILVKLRNLGQNLEEVMMTISKFFKEEDLLFLLGQKKGIEKGRHTAALAIAREMKDDKFSLETISRLTKLSIEEIEGL